MMMTGVNMRTSEEILKEGKNKPDERSCKGCLTKRLVGEIADGYSTGPCRQEKTAAIPEALASRDSYSYTSRYLQGGT